MPHGAHTDSWLHLQAGAHPNIPTSSYTLVQGFSDWAAKKKKNHEYNYKNK